MLNNRNIRSTLLKPLFLGFAVLFIVGITGSFWLKYSFQQHEKDLHLSDVRNLFQDHIHHHAQMTLSFLEFVAADKEILGAWQKADKDKLLALTSHLYTKLGSNQGITHFYFINSDKTVFLRVHEPLRHSDVIHRNTLKFAAETGQPSSGIEIGVYGTITLRTVYPVVVPGKFTGFIEMGIELDNIASDVSNELQTKVLVLVEKKFLSKDKWDVGKGFLHRHDKWDTLPEHVMLNADNFQMMLANEGAIEKILATDKAVTISVGDVIYQAGYFSIDDVTGEHAAEFIVLRDVTAVDRRFMMFVSVGGLVVFALFAAVTWVLRRYAIEAETELNNSYSQLENEIVVRKDVEKSLEQHVSKLADTLEQLRLAMSAKDRFLATMSHEIRTPIHGITGILSLLKDEIEDGDKKNKVLIALRSTELLNNLLTDLLDYSKLESGKVIVESTIFNLSELIDDVVDVARYRANGKGLDFTVHRTHGIPEKVIGDPTRIRQVLNNLINNAIKFTEKGSVTLDVSKEASTGVELSLRLDVIDTGIGIAEESHHLIFSRFAQADSSVTRRFGGTGLGLAISKQLTELMHGKISFTSEPGKGSCFTVILPLKIAPFDEQVIETNLRKQVASLSVSKERRAGDVVDVKTILVVDDNDVNRTVLKGMVKKAGYRALEANDGQQALEMLAKHPIDLVVMDCEMPVMSGYASATEIRQREIHSGHHIPILALSAYSASENSQRCYDAGMDEYIEKPINYEAFHEILQKWLPKNTL